MRLNDGYRRFFIGFKQRASILSLHRYCPATEFEDPVVITEIAAFERGATWSRCGAGRGLPIRGQVSVENAADKPRKQAQGLGQIGVVEQHCPRIQRT